MVLAVLIIYPVDLQTIINLITLPIGVLKLSQGGECWYTSSNIEVSNRLELKLWKTPWKVLQKYYKTKALNVPTPRESFIPGLYGITAYAYQICISIAF